MIIKFSKIQTVKSFIWPHGPHGDLIEVGKQGVVSIGVLDGVMIVTAMRGDSEVPIKFAVRDWIFGVLAKDQSDPLRCDKCGEAFANSQGLGKHTPSCKGNGHATPKDSAPTPA